ncbi:MAG: hypothetical protein ACJ79G_23745, partial [Myxococcales bacterium]
VSRDGEAMPTTIEGTFKDGKISLKASPPGVKEARVLVTFLPAADTEMHAAVPGQISFGMFKGERRTNEEDFRIAEWHGESEGTNGN